MLAYSRPSVGVGWVPIRKPADRSDFTADQLAALDRGEAVTDGRPNLGSLTYYRRTDLSTQLTLTLEAS